MYQNSTSYAVSDASIPASRPRYRDEASLRIHFDEIGEETPGEEPDSSPFVDQSEENI